jgi:hypothetical protein
MINRAGAQEYDTSEHGKTNERITCPNIISTKLIKRKVNFPVQVLQSTY